MNKKDVKISLIVPVYNTEKFLKKCLNSIIDQDLEEIEIICIDDGSTDNSLQILKEYENIDNRITVMTQKNSGVSVARNNGIAVSKGEFVMFVDSDDWIETNSLQAIYNTAKNINSDILIFRNDYYINENRATGNFPQLQGFQLTTNKNHIASMLYFIWNKLYKRSFIINNNIKFPHNIINAEDGIFNLECLYSNPIVNISYELIYHYRVERKDSACQNIKSLKNELKAFYYTFNSEKYTPSNLENKIITIEKYIKGILHWYVEICKKENFITRIKEHIRIKKWHDFLQNNIDRNILHSCSSYNDLLKVVNQNLFYNILSVENKYFDNELETIKRKYLKILDIKITLYKIKKNKFSTAWSLKILGITVIKTKVKDIFKNKEKIYFLGFIYIGKHNIKQRQKRNYLAKINDLFPEHDSYFTFACNCGELFLFLCHFNEIISRYNLSKPLFIFDKKRMGAVYQIFNDIINVPYVIVEDCNSLFLEEENYYNSKIFIQYFGIDYFNNYADNYINKYGEHYYDLFKKKYRISSVPQIPNKQNLSSDLQVLKEKLLNNKFIIISPDAVSLKSMSDSFWVDLCKKITKLGYKIFLNISSIKSQIKGTISVALTISEVNELAKYSTAIIGLRSGLLEILSTTSLKPTFAIYNSYVDSLPNKMSPQQAIKGFSLKKIPNINPENIYEYCENEYSTEELIYEIISKIEKIADNEEKILMEKS